MRVSQLAACLFGVLMVLKSFAMCIPTTLLLPYPTTFPTLPPTLLLPYPAGELRSIGSVMIHTDQDGHKSIINAGGLVGGWVGVGG